MFGKYVPAALQVSRQRLRSRLPRFARHETSGDSIATDIDGPVHVFEAKSGRRLGQKDEQEPLEARE